MLSLTLDETERADSNDERSGGSSALPASAAALLSLRPWACRLGGGAAGFLAGVVEEGARGLWAWA